MRKLENKVSIITGAGAGMGRAMALLFASEGSKVIATDINEKNLNSLQEEIGKTGGEATTLVSDIAITKDIDEMFEVAMKKYGTVDILVNNAGIMDNFSPVGEFEDETLQKIMDVNIIGPFKAMKRAVCIMEEKGSGSIINIGSVGSLFGARAGAAYTASKHALIGLSKNTAFMYAKKGIRTNVIAPGSINTDIAESYQMRYLNEDAFNYLKPGMGLSPRMGEAIEVARIALFLASEESSFVNGAVITADGGWSAY
ncbi:SDR family oxidoreductase [Bacteroidales bacterium OttesenSCG-928-B11]|nr:SDR family oxidoreductase [Bacteroidales bacterium OttesenSCG-928-B11]MDL2326372.1 SDR family oxidoreductase [Bacteroidales bacterium OttesenSCG-928-A14]